MAAATTLTTPRSRHRFLALGAATLGESGGRPSALGSGPSGPVPPGGARPSRALHPGRQPGRPRGGGAALRPVRLAVDVGDEDELGYWGEVLTTAAESRGIAGLVIDGGVRDTTALEAHGFPVFATTVALRGATKNRPGSVGVPVAVGGVSVAAGDWLVGDADGVTVMSRGGRGRARAPAGPGPTRSRPCSAPCARVPRPWSSSTWTLSGTGASPPPR